MRAIWRGTITFALVNIPVKLYTAVHSRTISFKSLCPHCHLPLRYKKWCTHCNKEIDKPLKGYEISKGEYVIVEDTDFESVKIKSTHTIEITEFVPRKLLPMIFHEKSFYIAPDEESAKVYSVFYHALRELDRIAIGRFTFHNREYIVAIEAGDNCLHLHFVYYPTEVKPSMGITEVVSLPSPNSDELALAKELINRLTKEKLDLTKFKDRYTEGLLKIIKAKAKGERIEVTEKSEAQPTEANLMDILKASLDQLK